MQQTKGALLRKVFANLTVILRRTEQGKTTPFALDPHPSDDALRQAQGALQDLLLEVARGLDRVDDLLKEAPDLFKRASARVDLC